MQTEIKSNITDTPLAADEVSVKNVVQKFGNARRYLLTRWKFVLLVSAVGGLIGVLYATFKKPVYTAECTFVLEEGGKSSGGLGQYSALASMVGIDAGSSSGLFQGDNIIQLYKSRLMLQQTLLSAANFKGKNQLLIDRYIELNKFRDAWKNNEKLKNISFDIPKAQFTIQHDSITGLIVADLNKTYLTVEKPDKKLSIISVKVKSTDQLFAKAFTENLVSNVNAFYIQTKTKGSLKNLLLLQQQADSVRRILNHSISGTAEALDANPNPNPTLQSLRVPSQRKQVDVQASSAIYAEVIKNLEIARGSLQRETPLIQVIDQPILPLINDKTGRLKALITGGLIAALFAMIWLLTIKMYRNMMS